MIALANFEFSAFNKKRIGYKDISSSKLSKKLQKPPFLSKTAVLVGVQRLELWTSCSQSEFRSFLLQIIANYAVFAFFIAIFVHF